MNKSFEEKLRYIYDVDCPICKRRWEYKITNLQKERWKEIKTCDCKEMKDIIHHRDFLMFGIRRSS